MWNVLRDYWNIFENYFSESGYMPHGHCYLWNSQLMWLHVLSDFVIGISYYTIPLIMFYFLRKRKDIPFSWMFVLFGIFIIACGTTHFFSIFTLWVPAYWVDGFVKLVTAFVSAMTAILFIPLVPKILALPSLEAERMKATMLDKARIELEQKVTERTLELSGLNKDLLKAQQVKSEFMSMVSHELRTPLSAIKEGLSLVLDGVDGTVTPDQEQTLGIVKHNVDRLARLVNNVLDIEKLQFGKEKMVFTLVDLTKLLTEVYQLMQMQVQKKKINFELSVPSEVVMIDCDADKMNQLLINLVDNATKFTKPNGVIKLELKKQNAVVQIVVADDGIGIDSADQGGIFDLFTQVQHAGTRKTGGFGVGLTICKQIVEKHCGQIAIDSARGKGCRFIITLPIKQV